MINVCKFPCCTVKERQCISVFVFVGYSAAVVENDNAAVDVIDSVADSDVVDVKKSVSSEGDYYEQA